MLYDDLFDLSRIISEKRSRSRLLDVCYSFEDVSSISAKNIKSIFESYKNKLMNVNEEKRRLEKNVKKCIVEWLQENCFAYKASTYAYEEEVRLVYKPKRNFFVWENKN